MLMCSAASGQAFGSDAPVLYSYIEIEITMDITFIMPGIQNRATGGSKIVFEYTNRLMEQYPDVCVTLCYLNDPGSGKRMGKMPFPLPLKRHINRLRTQIHPRWFSLNKNVRKRCIFSIDDASVPDGDWVFATAASTAQGVAGLSVSKGKKGYLIQDYETWELDEGGLLATYRLGMTNVAIAGWLKDLVDEATGEADGCVCISNPVDTQAFYPQEGVERDPRTVALLHHKGEHKGFRFSWAALQKVKAAVPDLKVEMFGACPPPDGLPDWVHYTKNANTEQLRRIYSASSAYLCASVNEGYGLTCVEAMACGCALVVTDFAGSREYAIDGVNSVVVPVGNVGAISRGVVEVLRDCELRGRLGAGGVETARGLGWGIAVERFAEVLGIAR